MKCFLPCLILLILAACQQQHFKIQGTLSNKENDGEWVYLVPLEKHKPSDVDSTLIKEGTFTFEGNLERLVILRVRLLLRMQLQEILVVTEPGIIDVKIGPHSSASGTPQNNALQMWKENKENSMNAIIQIRKKLHSCSAEDSVDLNLELDVIKTTIDNLNYKILKDMGDNTLGRFIYKNAAQSLHEEKQLEIDSLFHKN